MPTIGRTSALLIAVLGLAADSLGIQTLEVIRVPLQITPGPMQMMSFGLETYEVGDGNLRASLPGGGELQIERIAGTASAVSVRIPSGKPPSVWLLPGQSSLVWLKRTVGQLKSVPYLLGYSRHERQGRVVEGLSWAPAYRGEGRLRFPGCDVGLIALDLNGDGVFDRNDFRNGTSIGLDINGDGRVWGPAEYRKGEEIIDVCGVPLKIVHLDASSISFLVSAVKPAVVGQTVPDFSVVDSEGRLLRSGSFRGAVHVLDFWASSCAPCVAKLVAVDGLARDRPEDVKVIGINVDEPARRSAAENLIQEKRLSFPQVIRAQGEKDFLWQMFGSMQGVQLNIPLYVVIDRDGVIRYAGTGGEDLADLQREIQKLTSPVP